MSRSIAARNAGSTRARCGRRIGSTTGVEAVLTTKDYSNRPRERPGNDASGHEAGVVDGELVSGGDERADVLHALVETVQVAFDRTIRCEEQEGDARDRLCRRSRDGERVAGALEAVALDASVELIGIARRGG